MLTMPIFDIACLPNTKVKTHDMTGVIIGSECYHPMLLVDRELLDPNFEHSSYEQLLSCVAWNQPSVAISFKRFYIKVVTPVGTFSAMHCRDHGCPHCAELKNI
jgi:hypothetical protein